jgi:general secretion pathway protein I
LLEVMVALIIVSLGMMAVSSQLNRYTTVAIHVEQKTLASWIATNLITELSVEPVWPELGNSDEDVEFAGQSWQCRIEVSETPVENLRRIDVEVALANDPERVLHKVSGLVEPPVPAGFLPVRWLVPAAPRGGENGGRNQDGQEDDRESQEDQR